MSISQKVAVKHKLIATLMQAAALVQQYKERCISDPTGFDLAQSRLDNARAAMLDNGYSNTDIDYIIRSNTS